MVEEMPKHRVEMLAGPNCLVVNHVLRAPSTNILEKLFHRPLITFAERPRIADQFSGLFHAFELRRPRIGEVEFFIVQHMKHENVVPSLPQQPQSLPRQSLPSPLIKAKRRFVLSKCYKRDV